jgi:hypothetical protein
MVLQRVEVPYFICTPARFTRSLSLVAGCFKGMKVQKGPCLHSTSDTGSAAALFVSSGMNIFVTVSLSAFLSLSELPTSAEDAAAVVEEGADGLVLALVPALPLPILPAAAIAEVHFTVTICPSQGPFIV